MTMDIPTNVRTMLKKFVNPAGETLPEKSGGEPLTIRDLIAPPAIEVDFDTIKIGDRYFRTLFVAGYPRFVSANWLEPLISFQVPGNTRRASVASALRGSGDRS